MLRCHVQKKTSRIFFFIFLFLFYILATVSPTSTPLIPSLDLASAFFHPQFSPPLFLFRKGRPFMGIKKALAYQVVPLLVLRLGKQSSMRDRFSKAAKALGTALAPTGRLNCSTVIYMNRAWVGPRPGSLVVSCDVLVPSHS